MALMKKEDGNQTPSSVSNDYSKYQYKECKIKTQIISGTPLDIEEKYEIIKEIGKGDYGVVLAAKYNVEHNRSNDFVAIKKFENVLDHKILAKETLRELKILRLLKHENIISLRTLLLPRSREDFKYVYAVSELMEVDLGSILRHPQLLTDDHCQFFLYQILRGKKIRTAEPKILL